MLSRNQAPITTVLVGINVLVFAAMTLKGVSPVNPTAGALLPWGANWGTLSLGLQPWRMLTSTYVHAGILHIGLNMWCLWNLGFLAERIFDPWTYVLTYTACGLAGSIASLWLHPMVVGVGASGAIFGLAGALIAALYLGHLPIAKEAIRGTLKSLVAFAGYNLFFGAVAPFVDNSAHIGGLVCGLAVGALLAKHLTAPPEARKTWRAVTFIATAVILFIVFEMVKRANGKPLPPAMQAWHLPYSVPASSSSSLLIVSPACPRTAKVNF
jgi:rhomboid protease GluP